MLAGRMVELKRGRGLRRPFNGGAVFSRSLSIWAKNIIPFAALVIIVQLPLLTY